MFYTFGGGVEVGSGERLSVFGETRALYIPGTGVISLLSIAGVNFHF